jgi:outer membrane lipoprotein LolB
VILRAWRPSGRLAAGLVATLALAACASLPAPPGEGLPVRTGRLLVKIDASANAPAQQQSAGFEWTGDAQRGQLRLISPIGTQVALARWSPAGVELMDANGEREFPDLATLAAETLGEPMPLGALAHWLTGEPWPGAPSEARPGVGFAQLGWVVDLTRWPSDALIEARRAEAPAVVVRAKLDRGP